MTINQTTPLEIPRDGLVGEWLLNGDTKDTSGGGNDGTATDVTWIDAEKGYVSKVGDFSGTSYVDNISGVTYGTSNTASLWLKTTQTSKALIFSETNGGDYPQYSLELNVTDGSGKIRWFIGKNSTNRVRYETTDGGFATGDWVHITLVNVGNSITIYKDGISVPITLSLDDGAVTGFTGTELNIGNRPSQNYLTGQIGLIRMYNRAITEQEIQALYLEGQRKLGMGAILNSQKQDIPLQIRSIPAGIPKPILHITGKHNGDTYYDQSGSGNNGIQYGGVTTTSYGLYNKMSFDGSDGQYIEFNCNIQSSLTTYSVGGWYKISSSDNYGILLTQGTTTNSTNKFDLETNGGDTIKFVVHNGNGDSYSASAVGIGNDNQWHFIIGTFDGAYSKIYVDGVLINTSNSFSGSNDISSDNIRINSYSNNDTYNFYGDVAEIFVYEQVLTPQQIQKLYYSRFVS